VDFLSRGPKSSFGSLRQTQPASKIKVTDKQIAAVNLTGDNFHAEWHYHITPNIPPLINE